jgi:hypothetical protein
MRSRKVIVALVLFLILGVVLVVRLPRVSPLVGMVTSGDEERKVTLKFSGTLKDCCTSLSAQTGVTYQVQETVGGRQVSIDLRDAPVFMAHRILAKQTGVIFERQTDPRVMTVRPR